MKRRLMYYHTLLHKPDNQLAKNVFDAQMKFPVKNDWITTLKNDLTQCEITLSESEIKVMKKDKFKRLVNMKVKQLSDEYLIDLQQSHKKSRNIYVTENIKKYLISEEITLEQKRLLFQMRNFMCDVKTN